MKLRIYILVLYKSHDKTEVLGYAKPEGKMLEDSAEQSKTILVHSCPYCLLGDISRVEYLRQNTLGLFQSSYLVHSKNVVGINSCLCKTEDQGIKTKGEIESEMIVQIYPTQVNVCKLQ